MSKQKHRGLLSTLRKLDIHSSVNIINLYIMYPYSLITYEVVRTSGEQDTVLILHGLIIDDLANLSLVLRLVRVCAYCPQWRVMSLLGSSSL